MSTIISILNDLIETLKDGQNGFRAASEAVQSPNLKTVFDEYSTQRGKFVSELQSLARSLGEKEPESTGSVLASLHRGWINLKSAVTSQEDHAILAECERGEDSAVAEYRTALESDDLQGNVVETIQTQFAAVQAAHDRVRSLRDSLASK